MPQVATRSEREEHDDLLLPEAAFLRRSPCGRDAGASGDRERRRIRSVPVDGRQRVGGLVALVVDHPVARGLTALFLPLDLLVRRSVLHRARRAGYVRVFEGTVNTEDFTDKTRRWLEKTGLLHDDADAPNTIELYAKHNVVHRINGEEPEDWLSVILTSGGRAEDPLVLMFPATGFGRADGPQRRRLTAGTRGDSGVWRRAANG